jgi:hypothetical protein
MKHDKTITDIVEALATEYNLLPDDVFELIKFQETQTVKIIENSIDKLHDVRVDVVSKYNKIKIIHLIKLEVDETKIKRVNEWIATNKVQH